MPYVLSQSRSGWVSTPMYDKTMSGPARAFGGRWASVAKDVVSEHDQAS